MRSDAHFAIGHSHTVCQDYVRASKEGEPVFAALSDGCSGSLYTDFGARFLVQAAHVQRQWGVEPDGFHRRVLRYAWKAKDTMALPDHCLDATLLYGAELEGRLHCVAIGDGVVAARCRDGSIEAWSINFDDEAPLYLAYAAGLGLVGEYLHQFPGTRRVERWGGDKILGTTTTQVTVVTPATETDPEVVAHFAWTIDIFPADYDLVAIFSDGVRSFYVNGARKPIPFMDVLREILAIKNPVGAFAERRCRKFLGKTCVERGWKYDDDFSVAMFWMGD